MPIGVFSFIGGHINRFLRRGKGKIGADFQGNRMYLVISSVIPTKVGIQTRKKQRGREALQQPAPFAVSVRWLAGGGWRHRRIFLMQVTLKGKLCRAQLYQLGSLLCLR